VILPDVNVLIYAFYEDSDRHEVYARRLNMARTAGEE
jgi:predicted nucleic acid-binding protein